MSDDTLCDDEDQHCLPTRRLMLRPLERSDAEAISDHLADFDVVSMLSRVPWPYDIEDARDYLASVPLSGDAVFAITPLRGTELFGISGLHRISRRKAELGYWLGRRHWGEGYCTEAVQALIDFGFETLSLDRIEVSCRVVNEASRRVIRKCGFAFAGPGMIESLAVGRVAGEHYSLDRSSWRSIRMWGR